MIYFEFGFFCGTGRVVCELALLTANKEGAYWLDSPKQKIKTGRAEWGKKKENEFEHEDLQRWGKNRIKEWRQTSWLLDPESRRKKVVHEASTLE